MCPAEQALHGPDVTVIAESRADGFDELLARSAARPAALNIDGFFRGQVFSRPTEVNLQVIPDAVAIGPARPTRRRPASPCGPATRSSASSRGHRLDYFLTAWARKPLEDRENFG